MAHRDPSSPAASSQAQESGQARPCPFEAQAYVDGRQVARSSETLRLEQPGAPDMLCFPRGAIVGELPASAAQPNAGPNSEQSAGVLLSGAPDGYVAFDTTHPAVRVLLVDSPPGGTERDKTLKRFPNWGDAADLIKLLDVQQETDGLYISAIRDNAANAHRGVVEGSQLLGQAIVAAGRLAPERRVVYASMMFLRAASTAAPVQLHLEQLSGGRNFSSLAVRVTQGDKLCASGSLLLDVTAPDVIRHAVAAPEVAGPYQSEPYDMSVTHRDVRFVDGAYTGDPNAPVGPPTLDAWVRFAEVPADPPVHAALLAQFTGHASIAAAMRPHAGIGQAQAHRTLSTAINAITISFHANVRADQWMLYRHHSTFAGDGITHSECRVHTETGALIASFTVEAMVRRFATDRAVNERTAL